MPRATIYQLEANRNRAIEAFVAAFDQMEVAHTLAAAAAPSGHFDLPKITAQAVCNDWRKTFNEKQTAAERAAQVIG